MTPEPGTAERVGEADNGGTMYEGELDESGCLALAVDEAGREACIFKPAGMVLSYEEVGEGGVVCVGDEYRGTEVQVVVADAQGLADGVGAGQ